MSFWYDHPLTIKAMLRVLNNAKVIKRLFIMDKQILDLAISMYLQYKNIKGGVYETEYTKVGK